MKSKLELAKEMFNAKLQEAKSEESGSEATKSHEKPVSKKTAVYIKKPPRYMGVIGIGLALLVFYLGFDGMTLIWECSDWPSVSGTIISSDIRKTSEWERKGIKSGWDRTLYLPNILYNYEVQGNKYRSHRVFFADDERFCTDPGNAREIASRSECVNENETHHSVN